MRGTCEERGLTPTRNIEWLGGERAGQRRGRLVLAHRRWRTLRAQVEVVLPHSVVHAFSFCNCCLHCVGLRNVAISASSFFSPAWSPPVWLPFLLLHRGAHAVEGAGGVVGYGPHRYHHHLCFVPPRVKLLESALLLQWLTRPRTPLRAPSFCVATLRWQSVCMSAHDSQK